MSVDVARIAGQTRLREWVIRASLVRDLQQSLPP